MIEKEIEELRRLGMSWTEISQKLQHYFPELSETQVREKVRYIYTKTDSGKTQKSQTEEEQEKQTAQYEENGNVVSIKFIKLQEGEKLTPSELMTLHGFNPCKWQVVNCTNNFWNTQVSGGGKQISYQSKLTVKPITEGLDLAEIDKHFASMSGVPNIIPIKYTPKGLMAEVNVADLHFDKLCWHGDTPENYDYKIAREKYYGIMGEIIERLKGMGLDYIIFVWANDFFNSDTVDNLTTKGTAQDNDVRWQKMFNCGVEMLIKGIEALAEIAPVKTFYTPSNHDEVNGYHALKYIEAWFRNEPSVEVNIDAYPRKYHAYGNTLLGFCHGNKENSNGSKEKASRLASCMPVEAYKLWANTKYHEFHTAHLHSEQMIQEINGVIVRRIASPTATDTYHSEHGFIGSVRKAQTFIYDIERGLLETINTPV